MTFSSSSDPLTSSNWEEVPINITKNLPTFRSDASVALTPFHHPLFPLPSVASRASSSPGLHSPDYICRSSGPAKPVTHRVPVRHSAFGRSDTSSWYPVLSYSP